MSRPLTLITGASSGIGKAFADRFAKEGHDLIIVARRQAELEAHAEQLQAAHGGVVHVISMDLARASAADELFEEVQKRGLAVDNLINNAGVGLHGALEKNDPQTLERMVTLNVTVLTKLTRLFLPAMLERRSGVVLNVASTAAFQPMPYFAAYAATKAYVLSFSEGIAEEVRDRGVKVVALCPGPTTTEFSESASLKTKALNYARWMTAEQVVEEGMQAIRHGEVVRITGAMNALTARGAAFVPRALLNRITGALFRPS
ncbi:MAG TPA: SDR family oxidoreductase [Stenomitos sp.]